MRVHFYANMRTLVGQETFDITELEDSNTLGSLLAHLVQQFPILKSYLLDPTGELRQDVPIFIDGRNPRLGNTGLDALIDPDAVISLFSPISSGRMNVEVMRDSS